MKVLDQMKTEFVSIASHQLRNPLTSIRGYTSMLLEGSYGKLPKKALTAIENIAQKSEMMAASVEDYLTVSRIEAGSMQYNPMDFNLKDEVSHAVDTLRREATKQGLLLTFKTDLSAKGVVHADIQKVQHIIQNLLSNAFCYTPRGMITVFIHDEKNKIHVDIIDSGIGMNQEELEDIFDKFQRAQNAPEIDVTGTGLGLFVAQKMAQQMDGDITAFSDGVGKGSTFRFTLPLHM